jgi:hypothetical protein
MRVLYPRVSAGAFALLVVLLLALSAGCGDSPDPIQAPDAELSKLYDLGGLIAWQDPPIAELRGFARGYPSLKQLQAIVEMGEERYAQRRSESLRAVFAALDLSSQSVGFRALEVLSTDCARVKWAAYDHYLRTLKGLTRDLDQSQAGRQEAARAASRKLVRFLGVTRSDLRREGRQVLAAVRTTMRPWDAEKREQVDGVLDDLLWFDELVVP